jgi:hypothetical protein
VSDSFVELFKNTHDKHVLSTPILHKV